MRCGYCVIEKTTHRPPCWRCTDGDGSCSSTREPRWRRPGGSAPWTRGATRLHRRRFRSSPSRPTRAAEPQTNSTTQHTIRHNLNLTRVPSRRLRSCRFVARRRMVHGRWTRLRDERRARKGRHSPSWRDTSLSAANLASCRDARAT